MWYMRKIPNDFREYYIMNLQYAKSYIRFFIIFVIVLGLVGLPICLYVSIKLKAAYIFFLMALCIIAVLLLLRSVYRRIETILDNDIDSTKNSSDTISQLKDLSDLLERGHITREEFDERKSELFPGSGNPQNPLYASHHLPPEADAKLKKMINLFECGYLTREEFEQRKQRLLDENK